MEEEKQQKMQQRFHCSSCGGKSFRRMHDHRYAVQDCQGEPEECTGEENCEVCQEYGKLKN